MLAPLLFALLLVPVKAAPTEPPSKEQIDKWVRQLGDDEFAVRQEASRRLWEAGPAAEAAVRAAAKSSDAEVRRRALELLEKFDWGIFPETPHKVIKLIERFRNGEHGVLEELFKSGIHGCRAVLRIAERADNIEVRRQVHQLISQNLALCGPIALDETDADTVEQLLRLGMKEDPRHFVAHYAAYWLLRDKIDERIAHHKELLEKATMKPPPDAEVLARLYRAKGDFAAARQAADKTERADLIEALLYEAGDWKELARREAPTASPHPIEKAGLRAAYLRLAGDAKGARTVIDERIVELREAKENPNGAQPFFLAKALFINDRPADALALLDRTEQNLLVHFDVLCAQLNYGEAFALVERARKAESAELPYLEIAMARTLYVFGEKDKAKKIFASYAERKDALDSSWLATLIEAEYHVGLQEQALEQLAHVLSVSVDQGWGPRLFPKLFPEQGETATIWWGILRERTPDKPEEAMKRLRDVLAGKLTEKEVTQLIQEAMRASAEHTDRHYLALAEVALVAKLEPLALSCLKEASNSPEALSRLGDLHAQKKEWAEAAELYRKTWEKAPQQPLPLYLTGRALVQAAKEKEGRKLMEQSHMLPLGDERVRSEFALALARRGEREAAHRENELLLRLSEPGSFLSGEALRRLALDALARKDWATAAAGHEQAMLRIARTTINFQQPGAYVGVPTLIHRLRASAALAADKIDDARGEIALCQAAMPGTVDVAITLVPQLERKGHKKDAAELFERTLAKWEKVCEDYPRCAGAHNSAAWVSVCCRRNLDKALEHSLKAVELEPGFAGFHDTLAEIYFQRGDKEKAVATQKKVIELDPKKTYFRKQLKRIEAGDPTADRPSETDDD
jgi:tetratricopeptide (TPR) repeat protein